MILEEFAQPHRNKSITRSPSVKIRNQCRPQEKQKQLQRDSSRGRSNPFGRNPAKLGQFKDTPEEPPIHRVGPLDTFPKHTLSWVRLEQKTHANDCPDDEPEGGVDGDILPGNRCAWVELLVKETLMQDDKREDHGPEKYVESDGG